MYDHLRGEVVDLRPARAVLLVSGVGWELEVPTGTWASLAVGQQTRLFTILHVVDGTPSLLGFAQRTERELARALLTVNGVGKAMTLAILSTYAPGEVARAILDGNHQALRRVKGVGPKTAERLCLELRDRVTKLDLAGEMPPLELLPRRAEDAVAALVTLGYSEKEARAKVGKALDGAASATTEELIKGVLRG
jgi:Holliday junction DNA helicase RuvA